MKTFPLEITSPDGSLFAGDVVKLSVRGIEGELAIMAGHIPFVTSVNEGPFHVDMEDGSVRYGISGGGILTVSSDAVIFLSGSAVWSE